MCELDKYLDMNKNQKKTRNEKTNKHGNKKSNKKSIFFFCNTNHKKLKKTPKNEQIWELNNINHDR